MTEYGHLQTYDLTLTVKSPTFIGSGKVLGKMDYIFDPRSRMVSMIDMDKFIRFLIDNRFAEAYELWVMNGGTNIGDFLRRNCNLEERQYRPFIRYTVDAKDSLDENHTLKEIHGFMRNAQSHAYIPGSSVKGALRTTMLLQKILEDDPQKGNYPNLDEGKYFHTLQNKMNRDGTVANDMVNSILRGVMISDSEPINDQYMMLSNKTDAYPTGETAKIPLCRECLKPGTKVRMKLTLDLSVLHGVITKDSILWDIAAFSEFYDNRYATYFEQPRNVEIPEHSRCLILGGGSGFFAKTVAYPNWDEEALEHVANYMASTFKRHKHADDIEFEISPHTMKYTEYNRALMPYGYCEVDLA